MATTVAQHQVSAISDPATGAQILSSVVRGNDQTLRTGINDHDADTGIHLQSSSLASRPAAGTSGRKWITSDGLRIYLDNGSSWDEAQYLPLAAGGTVAAPVIVQSTTANQLQVGYDGSNHLRVDTSSAGAVTFNATGAGAAFTFSDAVTINSTANPILQITGASSTKQFSIAYDGSNYLDLQVQSDGAVTFSATGAGAGFTFSDGVVVTGTGGLAVRPGASTNALEVTTTGAINTTLRYDGSNRLDISVSSAGAVTFDAVGAGSAFTFSDTVYANASLVAVNTAATQIQARYDGSNRLDISVSSAGAVTFDAVGAGSAFTFSDAVTCSSTLAVTGDFAVNTNKFTVAASSGNTVVAGTLTVTGAAQFNGATASFQAGSAAAPSIYVSGTLSGLYEAGSNTLGVATNGAVSAQFDNTATAGQTRFLVYDVDNATLERVTVGAADSGGAGFKVLRIPN